MILESNLRNNHWEITPIISKIKSGQSYSLLSQSQGFWGTFCMSVIMHVHIIQSIYGKPKAESDLNMEQFSCWKDVKMFVISHLPTKDYTAKCPKSRLMRRQTKINRPNCRLTKNDWECKAFHCWRKLRASRMLHRLLSFCM